MKKRIVITGMGAVTPIGIGLDEFAKGLREGKSGANLLTKFDLTNYSTKFCAEVKNFNIENYTDKKRGRRMAGFTKYGFAAAKMAIEDAGLDVSKEDLTRIGVITGTGIGGLEVIEEEVEKMLTKGAQRVSPFLIPMIITNMLPGEIAMEYGFTGVNYAVTSACASANHAIGDALRMLRAGDADVIITGGSEAAITPLGFAGFCNIQALSTR
ncbi:MAG: beta-ketoacyl-[acyl-carrier-protein] synthase II, partial [Elusimicrobia bacterium]|nr:beta-ketoacyl-[acyl-carrier-protein] synthase II [Elusimicrobiota bacterium]